jgi:hypothetical protein
VQWAGEFGEDLEGCSTDIKARMSAAPELPGSAERQAGEPGIASDVAPKPADEGHLKAGHRA